MEFDFTPSAMQSQLSFKEVTDGWDGCPRHFSEDGSAAAWKTVGGREASRRMEMRLSEQAA